MKILYFAKFRQVIGKGEDDVIIPPGVKTVYALIDHLKASDERIAEAFADARIIRVAINQNNASLYASLDGATEVAFFPPVTGG